MTTETGPIQLLTIAFGPDATFEGRIVEELDELMAAGQILVLDLLVVQKQAGGDLVSVGYQAEGMGDTVSALLGLGPGGLREAEAAFPSLAPGRAFGLTPDDVRELADELEPGTTAGFLLFEHRWARKLRRAVREQEACPWPRGSSPKKPSPPSPPNCSRPHRGWRTRRRTKQRKRPTPVRARREIPVLHADLNTAAFWPVLLLARPVRAPSTREPYGRSRRTRDRVRTDPYAGHPPHRNEPAEKGEEP